MEFKRITTDARQMGGVFPVSGDRILPTGGGDLAKF
jgi:hypothetical protein